MPETLGAVLEDVVRQVALQLTTSDQVLRRDVIRNFIYRGAGVLTDATMIFPEKFYNGLDIQTEFNSNLDVDYPVAEGAEGEEGRIEWTKFYMILEKAEGSFKITDEAKIRGYQNKQWTTGVRSLARAYAKKKNYDILSKMVAGFTLSNATGGAWDTSTDYVVSDIGAGINAILEDETADIALRDIRNMVVALPIKAFNIAAQLTTIANLKMSFADYIRGQFPGLKIVPFKEISKSTGLGGGDDGYVVVTGEETGEHGVYRAGLVPLVEQKRKGASTKYTVRQFFASKVVPDSDAVATSSRIYQMTGILGTP
ncbi:MAG: hypothetical protein AM326_03050 [Candidatus Thorarchaeota archaeon SMTZ-45]|nr:MAG: hypothetical protein AM326_03050 [Candidatus Thorarchaeota archaeon SMTZ-45]